MDSLITRRSLPDITVTSVFSPLSLGRDKEFTKRSLKGPEMVCSPVSPRCCVSDPKVKSSPQTETSHGRCVFEDQLVGFLTVCRVAAIFRASCFVNTSPLTLNPCRKQTSVFNRPAFHRRASLLRLQATRRPRRETRNLSSYFYLGLFSHQTQPEPCARY